MVHLELTERILLSLTLIQINNTNSWHIFSLKFLSWSTYRPRHSKKYDKNSIPVQKFQIIFLVWCDSGDAFGWLKFSRTKKKTINVGQNFSATIRKLDTSHIEMRQETSIEVRTTYYDCTSTAMIYRFHESKSNLLTDRSTMTRLYHSTNQDFYHNPSYFSNLEFL